MMSIPKRQHTIPRVYLEGFTTSDGRLDLYSKRKSCHLRPKPEDAFIRRYYYSQPVEGVINQFHDFETRLLHSYEEGFPSLRRTLIETPEKCDTEEFFEFLLTMRVRSPAFREAFELGLADYVNDYRVKIDKATLPPPPEGFDDIWDHVVVTIDPHRSIHGMLHYLTAYCKILDIFEYRVLSAPRSRHFMTSDSPVVWVDWCDQSKTTVFFPQHLSRKSRIFFPLTKDHILVGFPTGDRKSIKVTYGGEISRERFIQANTLQMANAWDHVVSSENIPRRNFERLKSKQVEMWIQHFDPSKNTFVLGGFRIKSIRDKYKH